MRGIYITGHIRLYTTSHQMDSKQCISAFIQLHQPRGNNAKTDDIEPQYFAHNINYKVKSEDWRNEHTGENFSNGNFSSTHTIVSL